MTVIIFTLHRRVQSHEMDNILTLFFLSILYLSLYSTINGRIDQENQLLELDKKAAGTARLIKIIKLFPRPFFHSFLFLLFLHFSFTCLHILIFMELTSWISSQLCHDFPGTLEFPEIVYFFALKTKTQP